MTIDDRLSSIFLDILEIDTVEDKNLPRSKYENWDSLANVNILMAVIDEFGIRLSIDEMTKIECYSDLLRLLEQKL